MPFPEIDEILKAYTAIKGGKGSSKGKSGKRPLRPDMPALPDNLSPAESHALEREMAKEDAVAKKNAVHVSMLPLEVQHAINTRLRKVPRPE